MSIRRPKPDGSGTPLITIEGNTRLQFDKCIFDAANLDNSECVVKIIEHERESNVVEFEEVTVKGSREGVGIMLDRSLVTKEKKQEEASAKRKAKEELLKKEEVAKKKRKLAEKLERAEMAERAERAAASTATPVTPVAVGGTPTGRGTRGAWSNNKSNKTNVLAREREEKEKEETPSRGGVQRVHSSPGKKQKRRMVEKAPEVFEPSGVVCIVMNNSIGSLNAGSEGNVRVVKSVK